MYNLVLAVIRKNASETQQSVEEYIIRNSQVMEFSSINSSYCVEISGLRYSVCLTLWYLRRNGLLCLQRA